MTTTPNHPDQMPSSNALSLLRMLERLETVEAQLNRPRKTRGLWIGVCTLGVVCIVLLAGLLWQARSVADASTKIAGLELRIEFLAAGARDNFDTFTTEQLVIVGKDNRPAVVLGSTEQGEGVVMTLNNEGQELVMLSAAGGQGAITTLNSAGQELVSLGVTTVGQGTVTTFNGAGNEIVSLGVTTRGDGIVTTFDNVGRELVRLGVSTGGNGTVRTCNGNGQEIVSLGVSESGHGIITTYNSDGRELVTLTVTANGEGGVIVYDPSGRYRRNVLVPDE